MKKIVFWGILLLLASCAGPKQLRYMQDLGDGEALQTAPVETYRLQAGDQVSIRVTSFDRSAISPFNVQDGGWYDAPFVLDEQGQIAYPGLGMIVVAGKTVSELTALLQAYVTQMAKGALVRVELVSGVVSVLGEVRNPGRIDWREPGLTLFEALAHAGDLLPNASREVVVLRKNAAGVKSMVVNLKSKDCVSGEAWQLLPGDVVYVAPRRGRLIYRR